VRAWSVGVALGCVSTLVPGAVLAAPAPPDDQPQNPGAVIEVPVGCPLPDPAAVVFVGTLTAKDFRTGRFEIDQIRAGNASPWSVDGLIDVRYGPDAQFLDVGTQYLIGAGVDPDVGVLSSRVTPPAPLFGGNDIIGVDDVDVECPDVDDPIRTLNVDGSSVDSALMQSFVAEPRTLLAAWAIPLAVLGAALIVLIIVKRAVVLGFAGIFALGRSAVTPAPDHRAVRLREHRPRHEQPADEPTHAPVDVTEPVP
jgi:hypothetical protein